MVSQGPRGVDELATMTGLSVANASKHLQELRQAGLVKARKEGVLAEKEAATPPEDNGAQAQAMKVQADIALDEK